VDSSFKNRQTDQLKLIIITNKERLHLHTYYSVRAHFPTEFHFFIQHLIIFKQRILINIIIITKIKTNQDSKQIKNTADKLNPNSKRRQDQF